MIYHPIWSATDDQELATAIGDVILAWTQAEYDLVAMLAAMLDIPFNRASQLYHKIPNFRGRVQALYALMACTDGFEQLRPFIAKLSSLSKTRNAIVHGAFIRAHDGSEIRRVRLDEPTQNDNRSVVTKAHDIHQHADTVRANCIAFREAGNAISAYKAWLGPHPTEPAK